MAYLNYEQERFLIEFFQEYLHENSMSETVQEMIRLDIMGGLRKDSWHEITRQDIEAILESDEVELTEEQMGIVMNRVFNYDHSDYNEYISYTIEEVRKEKK